LVQQHAISRAPPDSGFWKNVPRAPLRTRSQPNGGRMSYNENARTEARFREVSVHVRRCVWAPPPFV
jgi:hypothetical protein